MKRITFWLLHFGLVLLKLFETHASFAYLFYICLFDICVFMLFSFVFIFNIVDAECFAPPSATLRRVLQGDYSFFFFCNFVCRCNYHAALSAPQKTNGQPLGSIISFMVGRRVIS